MSGRKPSEWPPALDNALDRLRIEGGSDFRLSGLDPRATLTGRSAAERRMTEQTAVLRDIQQRLYAQKRSALLVILQSMDAGGKDGIVRHVMSCLDPRALTVTAFRSPTPAESRHDFLWRTVLALPERGSVGVFNRSYYEEVLVPRVHPDLLEAQGLPPGAPEPAFWQDRFESIRQHECHLQRIGTAVVKIFLHISREEQRRRLISRIDKPSKQWKFDPRDIEERSHWDHYMQAYEDAIRATATPEAPWYVIPADHKWSARSIAMELLVEALAGLDPDYPARTSLVERQLRDARSSLLRDEPM